MSSEVYIYNPSTCNYFVSCIRGTSFIGNACLALLNRLETRSSNYFTRHAVVQTKIAPWKELEVSPAMSNIKPQHQVSCYFHQGLLFV